jgi:hypothetical protein
VLEHTVTLGYRQRLLGKSRQQIRIRMRPLRCAWQPQTSPQAVVHDLGYLSHFPSDILH